MVSLAQYLRCIIFVFIFECSIPMYIGPFARAAKGRAQGGRFRL